VSVKILFYQGRKPEDCFVVDVFKSKADAIRSLSQDGWYFNVEECVWYNKDNPAGFIEILEKEVH
jgi:hypothetical protein